MAREKKEICKIIIKNMIKKKKQKKEKRVVRKGTGCSWLSTFGSEKRTSTKGVERKGEVWVSCVSHSMMFLHYLPKKMFLHFLVWFSLLHYCGGLPPIPYIHYVLIPLDFDCIHFKGSQVNQYQSSCKFYIQLQWQFLDMNSNCISVSR